MSRPKLPVWTPLRLQVISKRLPRRPRRIPKLFIYFSLFVITEFQDMFVCLFQSSSSLNVSLTSFQSIFLICPRSVCEMTMETFLPCFSANLLVMLRIIACNAWYWHHNTRAFRNTWRMAFVSAQQQSTNRCASMVTILPQKALLRRTHENEYEGLINNHLFLQVPLFDSHPRSIALSL